MTSTDPHRGLFSTSPYAILADETAAGCWAGQKQTLAQLKRLCTAWLNRSDSTLDVMWANLGAGKTHALLHLKHLLTAAPAGDVEPVIVFLEVPEDTGNFLDLYRKIALALPYKRIAKATENNQPGAKINPRLARAFRAMIVGPEEYERLALDWITGGRPGLKELKKITGIDSRIETDSEAESVLSDLIRIVGSTGQRFIILLDEFQRVAHIRTERKRSAVLAHVRTLFSQNPAHLSLVLAVVSRLEKTALELLPPELKTVKGMRPSIALPEFDAEEAIAFVSQRFAWYRPENYSGEEFAPFTRHQIEYVVSYIADKVEAHLIPRTILQVLGMVEESFMQAGEVRCDDSNLRGFLETCTWDND